MRKFSRKAELGKHQKLWLDPAIGIQGGILLGMLLAVILLTRLTKPLLKAFRKIPNQTVGRKSMETHGAHACPVYLILLCLISLAVSAPLGLGSEALIRPLVSAATAWAIYRLVSVLHKPAWLRLIAVIAFGLAAFNSFGLLEATMEVLELISFKVGDRTISVLVLNGVAILFFLLWISSMLVLRREENQSFPHLPPSLGST